MCGCASRILARQALPLPNLHFLGGIVLCIAHCPASKARGFFCAAGQPSASLRHFRKTMMSLLFWLAVSLGVLSILAGAAALVKDWLS